MNFHKAFYDKDFKRYVAFEIFPKTARDLSKVYNTGFHKWFSEYNSVVNYSVVIHTFRIIVSLKRKGFVHGEIKEGM